MQKRIPLAKPQVGSEELESINKVLESGTLTEGAITEQFEKEFARYLGCKNAIATTSCTTALFLGLLALGLKPSDEVIVPDFTFPATGNVVFHVGAKPSLVDIDLKTYNIAPDKVEKAVTKRTKAIIPVHLFGQSAEMNTIMEIAEKFSLHVIEDAACAVGSTYHGKKVGTLGDIACFSFHPRKILSVGEGGMLVTDDSALAEKARIMKNHGISKTAGKIHFIKAGYNFRLNDIASSIGLVQLRKLPDMLRERFELAKEYNNFLNSIEGIETPYVAPSNSHTYQTYCIRIQRESIRDKLISELETNGIETQIGTYALHLQPFYKECRDILKTDLSVSEKAFKNTMALPIYNGLPEKEQKYVCENLRNLMYQFL